MDFKDNSILGTGTGAGTVSMVRYHPATFLQFNQNKRRIPPGSGPGEALFHEMVHAMRQMRGLALHMQVPENPKFDNFEEFCAVVASNIYRSERGFKSLRKDHEKFVSLPENLSKPDDYYQYYKIPIDRWFLQQQDFCLGLAESPAEFNPLRFAAQVLNLMGAY